MSLTIALMQAGCLIGSFATGFLATKPGQGLLLFSFLLFGLNVGWWAYGVVKGGKDA